MSDEPILTEAEKAALYNAAQFLLAGEWPEHWTAQQIAALRRAMSKLCPAATPPRESKA
jgi:hypothetical protein